MPARKSHLDQYESRALYEYCLRRGDHYERESQRARKGEIEPRYVMTPHFHGAHEEMAHWRHLYATFALWSRETLLENVGERKAFLDEARMAAFRAKDREAEVENGGAYVACEALLMYLKTGANTRESWRWGSWVADTKALRARARADAEGYARETGLAPSGTLSDEEKARLEHLRARVDAGGDLHDDNTALSDQEMLRLSFEVYYALRAHLPAARAYAKQRRKLARLFPRGRKTKTSARAGVHATRRDVPTNVLAGGAAGAACA